MLTGALDGGVGSVPRREFSWAGLGVRPGPHYCVEKCEQTGSSTNAKVYTAFSVNTFQQIVG